MNLTPTEQERLTLFTAAELARRYRTQGIRLSQPEAIALIADEIITAARRDLDHASLVEFGGNLLTADDVLPGVAAMIPYVSVEVSMAEGTKLITVFDPIQPGSAATPCLRPVRSCRRTETSRSMPGGTVWRSASSIRATGPFRYAATRISSR